MRTTTKAATVAKAAKKSPLRVAEFSVTEKWVQVIVTIHDDHFPKFNHEANPARAINWIVTGRMTSLWTFTQAAKDKGRKPEGLFDISMDANKWGYNRVGTLNLKHSAEITFQVKEHTWREFLANCEFIGHPPEAVLRGAFGSRAKGYESPGRRH